LRRYNAFVDIPLLCGRVVHSSKMISVDKNNYLLVTTQVQSSMVHGSRLTDENCTVLRYRGAAHFEQLLPFIGSSTISSNMKNATLPQAKQPSYLNSQDRVTFVNKLAALAARSGADPEL